MPARRVNIVALLVVTVLCTGCVPFAFVVPIPPLGYTTAGKPINQDMIAFIRAGTTTKADVVWELGAPNDSGTDSWEERDGLLEDWISYTSWQHRGFVGWGVGLVPLVGGPTGSWGVRGARRCLRPRLLKIWFDEAGVVEHHEFRQGETKCEVE